jgi:hypothetical protein
MGQLRMALRQELRDEDAANRRWSDAALDRHLGQALRLVEEAAPAFGSLRTAVPTPARRRIDLSADLPPRFLWLDAVEYPADREPQRFRPFREEDGATLYLMIEEPPTAGEPIVVWYARGYTLTEAASDLPSELEETLLSGALAFALSGRAIETTDKLVPSDTPAGYARLGAAARERFERALRALQGRQGRPRWGITWDEGGACRR